MKHHFIKILQNKMFEGNWRKLTVVKQLMNVQKRNKNIHTQLPHLNP